MFCPGKSRNITACPELCKEGHYCPTPSEITDCPEGHYCRIGSTKPTKCDFLDSCSGTKAVNPGSKWYLVLVACVTVYCIACLYTAYLYLNKKFPFRQAEDDVIELDEVEDEETAKSRKKLTRRQSSVTTPKPKFTIGVQFRDLQLTLPNGICIMQGVTGELKGGQFTAIMGPSGAGKSTFLSLLSGKTEPTGGTLAVNGEHASLKDYRKVVGFVPQEDIMIRELSVEENIRHSAFMRLPASMSRKKKLERVYQVMESLDLLRIRSSIIGDEIIRGISGGQRKRVNVAMELVADPSLLALDEPTSGLDSTTSSNLCETLSDLAKTGVNVAAVIHQPKIEILRTFSNVLLLGVGGRTVYMGPTENMESYFDGIGFPLPDQMNPADYFMDVIAGLIPCEDNPDFRKEDLFDLWEDHKKKSGSVDDQNGKIRKPSKSSKKSPGNRKATGFINQTYLLFKRAVLQRCRVPENTLIPVILSASAGALIGYFVRTMPQLYYGIPLVRDIENPQNNAASQYMRNYPSPPQSQFAGIWIYTALAVMLVCIVSINTFGREKAVFKRELFSGTKPTAYWLAKTFESGLWIPLYAAIFVTVNMMLNNQPIPVIHLFLVIWVTMIGDSGIGHIVSLVVQPSNRGIVLLVSVLVLIMIFSGIMIKYKGKHQVFKAFFTFWTAQGFYKGSVTPYEDVFDVKTLNDNMQGYELQDPFGFNILYGMLTALFWHLAALAVMFWQAR
ncbi:unnamed protein product [Pseudo-nitzschia multistriata]|uniref:ABC transporter domain-containing protein n=1 Tax=Pseudo-nitzschia multistriata TaxID=183589 RepID=A0A448ZT10_9STRA|nr:unnamed protein product [Pseudo-nitzschia multistriata]